MRRKIFQYNIILESDNGITFRSTEKQYKENSYLTLLVGAESGIRLRQVIPEHGLRVTQ